MDVGSGAGDALSVMLLAAVVIAAGCSKGPDSAPTDSRLGATGRLDAARLLAAEREPDQWFTNGRDGAGTYYSPLSDVNRDNAKRLGLAWEFQLGTNRGLEATPIMIDGVLYAVGNWGEVFALDARTGRKRWHYDPEVDKSWGRFACCDVVNRGLSVWQGRVYVGSTDGWLHSIDATTGRRVWKVDTLVGRDRRLPYTISGAPPIAGAVVVIGNGGADFGVRGYVSAYDLATGTLRWRFYTVPHDPRTGPQEQAHLERALPTWDRNGAWSFGGGGTVWDGMAYDADLDLLYIGTGNASPYNWHERSPRGGANLYLASIVAIHAHTGEMAWYYQEVPRESWDYTATMKFVLADLTLAGKRRQVIMQAPKNGIYYVLDRATGELLSANPYATVNWTSGINAQTGQPKLNPAADYDAKPRLVYPSQAGAHNWQPMSYSAKTKFVYIPVIDMPMVYINTAQRRAGLVEGAFTTPGFPPGAYDPAQMSGIYGPLPPLAELARAAGTPVQSRGLLVAWDPERAMVAWSRPTFSTWDGGVLSTAGGIVLQGDAAGNLNVRADDDGQLVTTINIGTSIMAAPMTYKLDGIQYVAFMAGFGGAGGMAFSPGTAAYERGNAGRIIALRLDGSPVPHPPVGVPVPMPQPPALGSPPAEIARGEVLYNRHCGRCHFFGRSMLPDLRRMTPTTHVLFTDIVLRGTFAAKGMGSFSDVLSATDVKAIHGYIASEAQRAYASEQAVVDRPGVSR